MNVRHSEIEEIGLADLRQNASEVVRRVEAGEEFVVTVSGRPAARLVGTGKKAWVTSAEFADLVAGLPPWGDRDRDEADDFRDPWEGTEQRTAR